MLETTFAGVSRDGGTLLISAINLQVVNGEGETGATNGLGNVIVGYNPQRPTPATRTGSHYLVVGDRHEWTRYGGILTGFFNTATAPYASVSGGGGNTASGLATAVAGGRNESVADDYDTVIGAVQSTTDSSLFPDS